MAAKRKNLSDEARDFIKGKTKRVKLGPIKGRLGYSLVQRTASGAGAHSKTKRARAKAERREGKRQTDNW